MTLTGIRTMSSLSCSNSRGGLLEETLQLAVGNDMVMSRDISLEASATEELLGWIERNLPKIKASGFQRVSYENVSAPLQQRIQALLIA